MQQDADVAFLTETWLDYRAAPRIAGIHALQTPLASNQGILLLVSKRATSVQPVLQSLWTPNTIVAKAKFAD